MHIKIIQPASWIRNGELRPSHLPNPEQVGSPITERFLLEQRAGVDRRRAAMPGVLIVDDDDGMRSTLNFILKNKCRVMMAASGEEALRMLENAYDIRAIFLDHMLPGILGIEVLETIRQRWPAIQVTMISESGDPDLRVRAMELGAFHYMRKEFDFDWMNQLLAVALKSFASYCDYEELNAEIRSLRAERDALLQGCLVPAAAR